MFKSKKNWIFVLLNVWLGFTLLLILSSYLPHWSNTNIINWINFSLYFLASLLSFYISRKEQYNKDVFRILTLFLLSNAFSAIYIFTGPEGLFGDRMLMFTSYIYSIIFSMFFLYLFIIYTTIKYLKVFKKFKYNFILTLGILIPIMIHQFGIYFVDITSYLTLQGNSWFISFASKFFTINIFVFLFIIVYAIRLYSRDQLLGEYIHAIMAYFFIMFLLELIHNLSTIYKFDLLTLDEYLLICNLLFLIYLLFKKSCFLNSDFGQFYERLISQHINNYKIKIEKRNWKENLALIKFLSAYIIHRRNYLLGLLLILLVSLNFIEAPRYLYLNLFVILLSISMLFVFTNALYKKRERKGMNTV